MLKASNQEISWERYYRELNDSLLLPNEYVTRIFLGNYPNLNLHKDFKGKKICDIGCGDGRNTVLLNKVGFETYGTEITAEICRITKDKLAKHPDSIDSNIKTGYNWSLPFEDESFDYLFSWNACYYMNDNNPDFSQHISEFARVLKKGGIFVVSVPMSDCCTLIGAEELGNDLIRINTQTNFSYINGTIFKRFNSWNDIETSFGSHFFNFKKGELKDDCFGLPLNYYLFVCEKI
jgi:ubiquinone/menaquinone biosynthesis C-methylase UbiE